MVLNVGLPDPAVNVALVILLWSLIVVVVVYVVLDGLTTPSTINLSLANVYP